jgi:hypothetical protein
MLLIMGYSSEWIANRILSIVAGQFSLKQRDSPASVRAAVIASFRAKNAEQLVVIGASPIPCINIV